MARNHTLSLLLDGIGYRADDVQVVVVQHLHGDHIKGLREVNHAELLVSRVEWKTLSGPRPELDGLMRRHIELPGLRWRQIELVPIHDRALTPFEKGHGLFGDGSLMLISTRGHTAGLI